MILQSLAEYYEVLKEKKLVPVFGWSTARVSYALDISPAGELLRVIPLKVDEPYGKKTRLVPRSMIVPLMESRSSGVSANFLCDNSSYMLGIDDKGKPERSVQCFEAAKEKHLSVLQECEGAAAAAVKAFFTNWEPQQAAAHPVLTDVLEELYAGGNLIFNVDTAYAHEDPEVVAAWNAEYGKPKGEQSGVCLVTGQHTEIARLHGTLQGVSGAQSSGAALVSFNAPAFESYGKEQSFNAPVGTYAVFGYTTALTYLLADMKHKTSIGDTTVVYWSQDGSAQYQDAFSACIEPDIENYELIDGVFKNLSKGLGVDTQTIEGSMSLEQPFYILGLAPNAARLSVRFFYRDSFGNILKNIYRHYKEMEIVQPQTDSVRYMGMWRMLQETVNKKSRDKKPTANMAGAVFRAVVSGSRYPASLYQAVLGRIRAEQDDKESRIYKITRGRAAIIKACLMRNSRIDKGELTMALNEASQNLAYVLGREFALLEMIQFQSNNGINATIKDRYFNAACATPAVIFPVLFKLKNSHTRKLKPGQRITYERQLQELQNKIPVADDGSLALPKRLSLEEQGMFILGYYHQTQKNFEKRSKEGTENV